MRAKSALFPLPSSLHLYYVDELFDGRRRLLERRVLLRRQLDLDDLLEPSGAELARHADEQIADAVLPLQEHRTRDDLVLVEQDRFAHVAPRRAGRVPGAGADQLRDLRPAARRARDDAIDRRFVHQVGDWNTGDR